MASRGTRRSNTGTGGLCTTGEVGRLGRLEALDARNALCTGLKQGMYQTLGNQVYSSAAWKTEVGGAALGMMSTAVSDAISTAS
jgi:hypothetical protein